MGVLLHQAVERGSHVFLDGVRHVAVENHDGPVVSRLSAVVGGGEDGNQPPVVLVLEATQGVGDLVRADAEGEGVVAEEALGDVWSEADAVCAPVRRPRHAREVLGVGPHAVEHQSVLDSLGAGGALAAAVDGADVLHEHPVPAEKPPVHDKDALRNDGGEGEDLEELLEHHEDGRVVLALALVEEAPPVLQGTPVHLEVLVVSPVDHHIVWVQQFVQERNHQDLRRVLPPIRDVPVQEVPRGGARLPVLFEHPQEVRQLTVRVSAYHELAVAAGGDRHVVH
mmetsp:Transcript_25221/g.58431  ORF Transcript_25221/g.58431 Transcript_25221/m.58431 type:complete len:282 (-) Transcript_25221:771-1616(-)